MEALNKLHKAGQSLWINDVDRQQIVNSSLMQLIEGGAITGLSLCPQAVCHAISNSSFYDDSIRTKLQKGLYGEPLALELILEDIHNAADLLSHVFNQTRGVDGWAVLPLSPLLTSDPETMLQSVTALHTRVNRKNALITVPGLPDMSGAIEEIIFAGIPINISLIYSCDQYLGVAQACLRGIERRIAAGLKPGVSALISVPVSQLAEVLSREMTLQKATRVTIAIAHKIYKTMRTLHASLEWERVYNAGARTLRLAWVNSDDVSATPADVSLSSNLVVPLTVTAMSRQMMRELTDQGHSGASMLVDNDDPEEFLAGLDKSELDLELLINNLQDETCASQVKTWITMLEVTARKSVDILKTTPS